MRVTSRSNLNQLSVIMQLYMDDHRGVLPFYVDGLPASVDTGRRARLDALDGYIESAEVFMAPADPAAAKPVDEQPYDYTSYLYPPGRLTDLLAGFTDGPQLRVARFLRRRPRPVLHERGSWYGPNRAPLGLIGTDWRIEGGD